MVASDLRRCLRDTSGFTGESRCRRAVVYAHLLVARHDFVSQRFTRAARMDACRHSIQTALKSLGEQEPTGSVHVMSACAEMACRPTRGFGTQRRASGPRCRVAGVDSSCTSVALHASAASRSPHRNLCSSPKSERALGAGGTWMNTAGQSGRSTVGCVLTQYLVWPAHSDLRRCPTTRRRRTSGQRVV